MKAETLFLKKNQKNTRDIKKKNLVTYLLELIQVTQKEVMIQTRKLVKYKHLSGDLKKKNKRKGKQNKITRRRKLKLQLTNPSV